MTGRAPMWAMRSGLGPARGEQEEKRPFDVGRVHTSPEDSSKLRTETDKEKRMDRIDNKI